MADLNKISQNALALNDQTNGESKDVEKSTDKEVSKKKSSENNKYSYWNNFKVDFGLRFSKISSEFNGVYEDFNYYATDDEGHFYLDYPMPSNDAELERGVYPYFYFALTNAPSYSIGPFNNSLIKGTIFAMSIDPKDSKINKQSEYFSEKIKQYDHVDSIKCTVLEFDILQAFSERFFFQFKYTLYDEDILTGIITKKLLNAGVGIYYQLGGISLEESKKNKGKQHMLENYLLAGIMAEVSEAFLQQLDREAEFCNLASGPSGEPCSFYETPLEEEGASYGVMCPLTFKLFGEANYTSVSLAYGAYATYYPLLDMVGGGAYIDFSIRLADYLQFFIKADARAIKESEGENKLYLPDSGSEIGITGGFSLIPNPIIESIKQSMK